jgi:Ca2+-dependent lipid-binding protein
MNSGTLSIHVVEAKFTFASDYKMDPFVRVTIDKDRQQTKTLLNGGKNPKWREILRFKITPSQISRIDSMIIQFEAFDAQSDTAELFLGKALYSLSKIKNKGSQTSLLEIQDKSNKVVGSLHVELDFKADMEGSPQKNKYMEKPKIRGTLVLRPKSAQLLIDVDTTGAQDPYLIFIHGNEAFQTSICEDGGKTPVWNDVITFHFKEGEDLQIKCFDDDPNKDEMIGEGALALSQYKDMDAFQANVSLRTTKGKPAGTLQLEIEYLVHVFDSPVKIYPLLQVRSGETASKKIKYHNPDKFNKVLRIKSENDNIVLPKTKQISISANSYGEIRFKISPPDGMLPVKCRVDIIVEDTNIIEESLLFNVKTV